jgi:hypothetical protein
VGWIGLFVWVEIVLVASVLVVWMKSCICSSLRSLFVFLIVSQLSCIYKGSVSSCASPCVMPLVGGVMGGRVGV